MEGWVRPQELSNSSWGQIPFLLEAAAPLPPPPPRHRETELESLLSNHPPPQSRRSLCSVFPHLPFSLESGFPGFLRSLRQLLATLASLSHPAPPPHFSLVQAALRLSCLFSGTVSEKLNGRERWVKSQKAKKDLESMFDIWPLKNSTPSSPGKLLGATE